MLNWRWAEERRAGAKAAPCSTLHPNCLHLTQTGERRLSVLSSTQIVPCQSQSQSHTRHGAQLLTYYLMADIYRVFIVCSKIWCKLQGWANIGLRVFADTELAGWGGGWYNCSLLPSTRSSVVGFVLSNIYTFQLLEFALLIKLFWWTCSPSPLQSHQIIVSHQILCIEKKNSEFIPRNDQCIFWVQSGISRYFYLNGNRKVLLLILESFITSHLWILLHLWLQDWRP